jgi:BlaI family transcriptional regulator, penicillinase repressor
MHIVWRVGPLTAEEIRPRLTRALKESTVRTVLRRIEQKGYLTHDVVGRTFVFRGTQQPTHVAAGVVKRLAKAMFGGSVSELLVGLVDAQAIDARDLARAVERIEQAKQKGGRPSTTRGGR